MVNKPDDLGPLDWRIGIVDKTGRPTPEFQRRWQLQRGNNDLLQTVQIGKGIPPAKPVPADGEAYVDISTTPATLYVGYKSKWVRVGVFSVNSVQGPPGRDGDEGPEGPMGPPGAKGATGASGGGGSTSAVVQASTNSYNTIDTTSVNIRFGAVPTPGNLMIALVIFQNAAGAPNPPVGWTQLSVTGPGAGTTFYTEVVYRYTQAGDLPTLQIDTNGRTAWALVAWEITGVTGTIGTDVVATHLNANANVFPAPGPITTGSFTTLQNNELLLCGALGNSLTLGSTWSFSTPSGTLDSSRPAVLDGAGSDDGCVGMHIAQPIAGTAFTTTISVSANSNICYGILEVISSGNSGGTAGPTGPQGPQGRPGFDGEEGPEGFSLPGPQGLQGATGAVGPQGPIGFAIDGIDADDVRIPGPVGPQGATGAVGPQGPIGFAIDGIDADDVRIPGQIGPQGATGSVGPAGPVGRGIDGDDGIDAMSVTPWSVVGPIQGTSLIIGAQSLAGDTVDIYSPGLTVVRIISDGGTGQFASDTYGVNGSVWRLAHARGSFITPAALVAADVIANINFLAHEGTAFQTVARINSTVDTVTGSNNVSGYLTFSTRPDGAAATLTERLRIDKNGAMFTLAGANPFTSSTGNMLAALCPPYVLSIPTTGFTSNIPPSVSGNLGNVLILDPAGTLATGTLSFSAGVDGLEVTIVSTQTITAVTCSALTTTLKGAISTLVANVGVTWKYSSSNTTWYRLS